MDKFRLRKTMEANKKAEDEEVKRKLSAGGFGPAPTGPTQSTTVIRETTITIKATYTSDGMVTVTRNSKTGNVYEIIGLLDSVLTTLKKSTEK